MKEQILMAMECHELVTILETDYYRQMIAARPTDEQKVIFDLIDDILVTEKICAKIERYDLAIICRDRRVQLADHIALESLV